jgi:tetratricopeptide (TPR) repeat protein
MSDPRRFKVALSLPGEHRARVEKIATILAQRLGRDKVLFYPWYQGEFARPSLHPYLAELYRKDSDLIVFFLCKEYDQKNWCGVEWRIAQELILLKQHAKVMILRLDDHEIEDLLATDGFLDISTMPDEVVAEEILSRLGASPLLKGPTHRAFTGNLPAVDSLLIGREKELEFLDQSWENPKTNIVQIIAPGGTGKTALMDKWYKRHLDECTIFAWSFYSQGTKEDRQTSSDPFFAEIIPFFGIKIPEGASVFARAEAIAQRLREEKVLLILDGLEPLQESTGEMRDSAMKALLHELRTRNKGMALCTTRVYIKDLPVDELSPARDLGNLDPKDGASLLRAKGVLGTQEELEKASQEFHNHALAVTLLGTYLKEFHDGDIRHRTDIRGLLDEESDTDGHANRVMASYERMFHGKPELDVLRALGYFDRPAEPEAMRLLLKKAPERLTLNRLKKLGLILSSDPASEIDCHPLVREYFAKVMRETASGEFKAGHSLLYEYYSKQAPERPETRDAMVPLFHAVYHGCQAGRHQEACDKIYFERVLHGVQKHLTTRLGEWGTNLSLLAGFFLELWIRPVGALSPPDQSWVIAEAARTLQSLGRLTDAVAPAQASAQAMVGRSEENAARAFANLAQLQTALGNLTEAASAAHNAIECADRTKDVFLQATRRPLLSAALHQSGDLAGAARLFEEAEDLQRKHAPQDAFLYSFAGFQYCDLLIDQGQHIEVLRRATATLRLAQEEFGPNDIGLDHLSIGRAHPPNSKESQLHLDQAVHFLRRGGDQSYLVRALLARATDHDLEEAFRIATRSGMRLHLADYHLIQARRLKSLEHFKEAERLINECGYGRRKLALEELRKELNAN